MVLYRLLECVSSAALDCHRVFILYVLVGVSTSTSFSRVVGTTCAVLWYTCTITSVTLTMHALRACGLMRLPLPSSQTRQQEAKERPVIKQRINPEDEESLIENEELGPSAPRNQEDKPTYPWDKFMNTMAQQAGEAAATAAVASLSQQATQHVTGAPEAQPSSKPALTGDLPAEVSDNPFALE
eukprot:m.45117 g.45117  ORF g.45117 m.45117 type:complete len:184 (-) comp13073_c0_seq1:235-786(-)